MFFFLILNLFAFDVSIEKKDHKTFLRFPIDVPLATFIHKNIYYACFETKKKGTLPQESTYFLSAGEVFHQGNFLIFAFKPKPFVNVKMHRDEKGWLFHFFCQNKFDPAGAPFIKKSEIFSFPTKQKGYYLTLDNQEFFVVPSQNLDGGYMSFSFPNLCAKPAPCIQGASFEVLSDFFSIKKQNNEQILSSHYDEIFLDWKAESIFQNKDIHPYFKKAWDKILVCDGTGAKSVLDVMEKKNPFLKTFPLFKKIKGIALFLSNQYEEALKIMESLPPFEEVEIWRQMASVLLGHIQNIDLESIFRYIQTYPLKIRVLLTQRIAPLAHCIDSNTAKIWLDTKDIPLCEKKLLNTLTFFKTKTTMETLNVTPTQLAFVCEKLAKDKDTPPDVKVYAEFEAIKSQTQNNTLSIQESIHALEALKLRHRREDIEFPITLYLSALYKKTKNDKKSIEGLKNLQHLYPVRFYLNNTFEDILESIKALAHSQSSNPLKIISIYDDFYDWFALSDFKGDFTDSVVAQMMEMGLFQEAANLYLHSLNDEKDLKIRNKILIKTAKIYAEAEMFKNTLEMVELIDPFCLNEGQKKEMLTLSANAFYKMGQSKSALELLKGSSDKEHIMIRISFLMEKNHYEEAIFLAKKMLGQDITPKEKKEIEKKLALCYVETKDDEALKDLNPRHFEDPFIAMAINQGQQDRPKNKREEINKDLETLTPIKKALRAFAF
jgi:hypothetical protein